MDKAGKAEQDIPVAVPAASSSSTFHRLAAGKALSAKCVSTLFLAVGVFLSAFFLLLHLRAAGIIPDDPGTLVGEIQASFILLKSPTQLASYANKLEKEIHREIRVPNCTVSARMHALYFPENSTYVTFGILPYPRSTSMSAESMRALRKTLVGFAIQKKNLSLTPSIFGDPLCLEVLGFPGGISVTMELPESVDHVDSVQPIFNFTLDMSIRQIRRFVEEMKKNIGSTLGQAPYKDIYIDLTNQNGSTVSSPVTVQVSLSPNDRSTYQEPQRLKQLAEIITESISRNLGLNPLVFGIIKDFKLAPFLQYFVPSCAPSPSPTPIPSPSIPSYSGPTANISELCSCPDLANTQDASFPRRKLMRFFPMSISPKLPTLLRGGNTSGRKKNGIGTTNP